jgi:hypothetical protein
MWALELLDPKEKIQLTIDLSAFDKTTQLLLLPAHQSFKTTTIHHLVGHSNIKDVWWSDLNDNKLIYSNDDNPTTHLQLQIYEDTHQAYAFICKEKEMFMPVCLIFWSKDNLLNKNQGWGHGRFGLGHRVI